MNAQNTMTRHVFTRIERNSFVLFTTLKENIFLITQQQTIIEGSIIISYDEYHMQNDERFHI